MEEELELTTAEDIQNLIYTVRGKQVMLDSDVANLYHYETKKINQAVKRNIERFPEGFCFQLTESELENLRSQFVTSSLGTENYGGRRYLPYVFTEQGIAMLAPLLKNKIAVQVSINIMNAFVIMRHFLKENGQIFERLTSNRSNIKNIDIQKFNKQYPTLKVAKTDKFHDRFIILDEKEMYHLGASIKDLGKKCFGINKIENDDIIETLLRTI